jgi:hypothetical protein
LANLVHNEQAKLTATYLNGIAIAVMVVGVLAPVASQLLASTGATTATQLTLIALGCAITSVALHYSARRVLTRIKE